MVVMRLTVDDRASARSHRLVGCGSYLCWLGQAAIVGNGATVVVVDISRPASGLRDGALAGSHATNFPGADGAGPRFHSRLSGRTLQLDDFAGHFWTYFRKLILEQFLKTCEKLI